MKLQLKTYYQNPFPNEPEYTEVSLDKGASVYSKLYFEDGGYVSGKVGLYIDNKVFVGTIYTRNLHITWQSFMTTFSNLPSKTPIIFDSDSEESYLEYNKKEKQIRFVYGNNKTSWFSFDQMKEAIIDGFMHFMKYTNRDLKNLKYEDQEFYNNEILEEMVDNITVYNQLLDLNKSN